MVLYRDLRNLTKPAMLMPWPQNLTMSNAQRRRWRGKSPLLWSCGVMGAPVRERLGTVHLAKQTHASAKPSPTPVFLQPGRTLGRKGHEKEGPALDLEKHCKDNQWLWKAQCPGASLSQGLCMESLAGTQSRCLVTDGSCGYTDTKLPEEAGRGRGHTWGHSS